MTVLVFAELDGDSVAEASLRAATLARSLGSPVVAAVFDAGLPGGSFPSDATPTTATPPASSSSVPTAASPLITTLAAYDISDIYDISVDGYAPQAWARALAALASDLGATAVLAAGTDHGNEVMAHLGAITDLPMVANVVSVEADGALTRQRWAGLLLEDAVLDAPMALFTVATDAVAATPADAATSLSDAASPLADASSSLAVHALKPDIYDKDMIVRAEESAAGTGGVSLATARVVVGGGRGVGGSDGFAPLEELAGLLGGVVGVSRVVTSEGWRPHTMQVGQTGTKIAPELYLACGISGAIQHIAGCSGAKHIIAINTDPGAPILTHADYAVIGDLHEVIPALVEALKSR